ncbi:hypothetical protein QFC21_005189 [Naganishia friedmannii]|uniref:Uncharacterized protein n=1 Tax=Naganishia friedmannii TaxID=89922 RepID=A0ACC2VAK3_9TREE|nr:hypothetical protein QFC21_005189 [Naganishia friedmannii]
MSSQSGLSIPATITAAFTSAVSDPATRALVFLIPDSTAYALHATLPVGTKPHPTAPKGTNQAISDVAALLPALPSAGTCASFLFKADDQDGGWIHISYIPDNAPTRQKMLHASSKSTLLQTLSRIHPISTTLFFTSPGDLTPTGFWSALKSRDAPPPMTKSEEALRDIKAGEAAEAQERLERMFGAAALSPPSTSSSSGGQQPGQATRAPSLGLKPQPHVFGAPQPMKQRSLDTASSSTGGGLARGGVGAMGAILGGASGLGAGADKGALKWGQGVEEALKGLLEGGKEGNVVVLSIDAKSETIIISPSSPSGSACKPEELATRLPGKEPSYAFYAWPSSSTSTTNENPITSSSLPALAAPAKKDSLTVPGQQETPITPTEGQEEQEDGNNENKEPKDIALPVSPMPSSPAGEAPPSSTPSTLPSPASAKTSVGEERKIAFIYACPSASPVRNRMLFSTCVRGLIRSAEERCRVKVSKKIETSDISELSASFLKAELFDSAPPTISVPRGSTPASFGNNGNGSANSGGGVDTSSGTGDAWNAFGPRVGRPKPAGRR